KSILVALNEAIDPIRPWRRTDEYVERPGRYTIDGSGPAAGNRYGLQPVFAMSFDDPRAAIDSNIGGLCDLVNQILRHGCAESFAANQHHDAFGVARKIDRRLSGRIGATYYVHLLVAAGERFGGPCAVVHTGACQALDARNIELSPLHAAGD